MSLLWRIALCLTLLLLPQVGFARDAAFVEPGTFAGKGASADALVADPKTFEAGESTVGIMRRVSLFFVNTGNMGVTLAELTATGDGNVKVEIENSDCAVQSKVAGFSRCTVALAITPTSAGAWSVEILVKHDGLGRIARALVTGRAINDTKSAARAEGLNLSSRDMKPIDFGDVDLSGAPAVRTALMVNDSPETISIKAIDLIAVDKGLERLTTGCEVDQELKPDASCPITLKWQPQEQGNIATDLIMRHTGKIGFTVIPVRGKGIGDGGNDVLTGASSAIPRNSTNNGGHKVLPAPPMPSADEVENITGKLPPMVVGETDEKPITTKARGSNSDKLFLIGLVGTRAILQHGGVTKSIMVGEDVEFGSMSVKLLALAERKARVLVNGQQRVVQLGASDYRPASSSSSKNGKDDGSKLPIPSSISQSSSGK
ncbi:MAG: hypothetical protein KBA75_06445 [Alphaproteobacteria bacterium]|nr:hypothetical protein [Alphaproteobacteria bacterium]